MTSNGNDTQSSLLKPLAVLVLSAPSSHFLDDFFAYVIHFLIYSVNAFLHVTYRAAALC